MNPFDPILDQPQVVEYEDLDPGATYRLANQDLYFDVDATTDLRDLFWPWADAVYARRIQVRISDPHDDDLMVMATRFYPGYQEVILGSEGMIVSKRLLAPLGSSYDRAVGWLLECQAEGDRLLRLEVEIDWGEPLEQRMVDGLLVAQRNPSQARGIYAQQNAESTRVFGNPHGLPSHVELTDDSTAHLVYYVLVNGIVEVPLLLTVSDVGEQVAWNGFLALRDVDRVFHLSVEAWDKAVKAGRLWTSDPRLNRALLVGRVATLRRCQRLRTGYASATRQARESAALVNSLDTFQVTHSRNLLAHLRRVAEATSGRLPLLLPVAPKQAPEDPGPEFVATAGAYLAALHGHLAHHPDAEVAAEHFPAVVACAEALIAARPTLHATRAAALLAQAGHGLRQAAALAAQQQASADVARWESEAHEAGRLAADLGGATPGDDLANGSVLDGWQSMCGWRASTDRPWTFDNALTGIRLAGEAVWAGCGLAWRQGELGVHPTQGNSWRWWALLDLPHGESTMSLVWDGETLHSTQPVRSDRPVQIHGRIKALHTDEYDFDLQFEMTPRPDGTPDSRRLFKPVFDTP